MNSYVVTYSDYNSLFDDYETISGKNPIDALEKRFNKKFKRVTGDQGRYANVILVKGSFDKDGSNIIYKGRYLQLCYVEVN